MKRPTLLHSINELKELDIALERKALAELRAKWIEKNNRGAVEYLNARIEELNKNGEIDGERRSTAASE